MGLDEKMTERFDVTTNVSTQDILQRLSDGKQKQTWTDFLVADTIDYKEIDFNESRIEILRKPSMLTAFRPNGRITIDMTTTDNKTQLKCKILPFNGSFPTIWGFVIVGLAIWGLAVLVIGRNFHSLSLVLIGWSVFGLIMYLQYVYTKHALIDYSKKVIGELTRDKKASR